MKLLIVDTQNTRSFINVESDNSCDWQYHSGVASNIFQITYELVTNPNKTLKGFVLKTNV